MDFSIVLNDLELFSKALHLKMNELAPVCSKMEPYEFRYSLNNTTPAEDNWSQVRMESMAEVEKRISDPQFFESIQIKPKSGNEIVLDRTISHLTQMLFIGLVTGEYPVEWVNHNFYFDVRSFNFFVRSKYMTDGIRDHLGGKPFRSFERKQQAFESAHEVGYQEFRKANLEVDTQFFRITQALVKAKGTPIMMGIAGPTAAGKTEIVERLREEFSKDNRNTASIELDNFLLDRDYREEHQIGSFGKPALHFNLVEQCINDLLQGKSVQTPRYDFINGTSSHDLQGNLKPDGKPVSIAPADIIFIEGNSPFLLPEIAPLVGIKVVYLTDDPVRLKRKWRRDVDYRKKYDPYYLRNRFFKEQPPMAIKNYQPQLLVCDVFVNTTAAEVWVTPEIEEILRRI